MAIKKTDKPTPGTGAPQRKYNTVGPARTPSKTPLGRRPTKAVVKVQPKGTITKAAVKNPSAPKPVGSGAKSSVTILTKTESSLKKGKGKGMNSGAGKNATPPGRNRSMTPQEKYKTRLSELGTAKSSVLNNPKGKNVSGMVPNKGNKVTLSKKTPPAPKAKTKTIRFGRGGMLGGALGGGGFRGPVIK